MLKQHSTIFRRMMIVADGVIVAAAFALAYLARNRIDDLRPLAEYSWLVVMLAVIWLVCLYTGGMYRSFRLKPIREILYIIYQSAYFSFFIFAGTCYIFRIEHVSRLLVFFSFLFIVLALGLEKILIIKLFRRIRREGYNYKHLIVVGSGPRARRFMNETHQNPDLGLNVVGYIDREAVADGINGYQWLGTLENLPNVIQNQAIDHIVFIVPRNMLTEVEEAIQFCETVGVTVSVAVDLFNLRFTEARETSLFGFPLLTFESTPQELFSLMIKRVMDVIFSFCGLVILAPLFAVISLLIKRDSGGPIFFRQTRVTLNNRKFTLYKFRTMIADAENKLEDLKKFNEMDGPAFKMQNDPRITKLGRALRKYSIDEFPQLWNVLKGDMSLVGPRPPLESEVAQYDSWQRRRLSMRPGITCIWQAKGRNRIRDFKEWAKLDLLYIDNWSLWLDIRILIKTIPAVIQGAGAK